MVAHLVPLVTYAVPESMAQIHQQVLEVLLRVTHKVLLQPTPIRTQL